MEPVCEHRLHTVRTRKDCNAVCCTARYVTTNACSSVNKRSTYVERRTHGKMNTETHATTGLCDISFSSVVGNGSMNAEVELPYETPNEYALDWLLAGLLVSRLGEPKLRSGGSSPEGVIHRTTGQALQTVRLVKKLWTTDYSCQCGPHSAASGE